MAIVKSGSGACRDMTLSNFRKWRSSFLTGWRRAVQIGRASIGVPDYATYVAHVRLHHPESTPMSYEAFFIDRQSARYRSGGGRCC